MREPEKKSESPKLGLISRFLLFRFVRDRAKIEKQPK
jgi:hypothetical protein